MLLCKYDQRPTTNDQCLSFVGGHFHSFARTPQVRGAFFTASLTTLRQRIVKSKRRPAQTFTSGLQSNAKDANECVNKNTAHPASTLV